MWVIFQLEARRRFRNTANAMRATPATAETTPATMGVESEDAFCFGGAGTGAAVKVMPKEGAGDGPGDVAASDGEGAEAGATCLIQQIGQSKASQGKLCDVIGLRMKI